MQDQSLLKHEFLKYIHSREENLDYILEDYAAVHDVAIIKESVQMAEYDL